MTHNYTITGMTCTGCQAKVQGLLSKVPGVTAVGIDLAGGKASIDMSRHIPVSELQTALKDYPKYQLSAMVSAHAEPTTEPQAAWLATYKPILLVFAYILGGTLLVEGVSSSFEGMRWMSHFMAAFFLVFSFFKLLDTTAFADSYSSYDIIAARWRGWGLIYPFVELALGILFLTGVDPLLTNTITLVVMGVSIIGVIRSVMQKRKIQCACLGAVFNLPMSTITIIEDGLMIAMSAYSIAKMIF